MPEIKVLNMAGAEVGKMDLSDKVFGAEVKTSSPPFCCKSVPYESETGHTVHSDPHRGFRRRQKALETEGQRPRKTGFHPRSPVDARRCGSRSEAPHL